MNLSWILIPSSIHIEPGWFKLNTDGSFAPDGSAGTGMILRDHRGKVVFTSCRNLSRCSDVLEAELAAAREGIALALNWCSGPFHIEVDCLDIVRCVQHKDHDLSEHMTVIEEIKSLLNSCQTCITHVKRNQNSISHFLANYARPSGHTAVLVCSGPEDVENLCLADCNPYGYG